jgi:tryptophan halogenase
MAASGLARALQGSGCEIRLVESAEIGTVGVGEATIPPILDFLAFLGIDLDDFVRRTQATYKLGIKFRDWRRIGHAYWHPFGVFGTTLNRRPFYAYWQKARAQGLELETAHFSVCAALGEAGRFSRPEPSDPALSGVRYALHFDAGLVARYLRAYAEHLGVERLERTVAGATRRADGRLGELVFADGGRLEADLYVDCSGFRGLLIEEALKTGYVDWTPLLPCDRAVAMQTKYETEPEPYTLSVAQSAGWRWRIPLQHRAGNGYVYSSAHISDDAASEALVRAVGEAPATDPRVLRFTTGRRRAFWVGNCVALGLASGFLEPLESTSLHLVISHIYNLIDHFPDLEFDPANIDAYNRRLICEYDRVRDFIILHYRLTERDDGPFWRDCRRIDVPDSLGERLEFYRGTGRILVDAQDVFTAPSWFYVLDGMGCSPSAYDPIVDVADFDRVRTVFAEIRADVEAAVARAKPLREVIEAPATRAIAW